MKRINMMNTSSKWSKQQGYNLLEVMIGIAIFAIGMIALASLQGNLTRSASDSNIRGVAVNLAEALIEQRRGFARLSDATNTWPAYDDIINESRTVTRGGIPYTISSVVENYYYDLATDTFKDEANKPDASVSVPDYKQMTVTVSWTTPDFVTTDGNTVTQSSLGTGSIQLVETIASVTTAAASKAITQTNDDYDAYSITYQPGLRPDIVSLSLGNTKFKESLTPEPDVIRQDELVDTRFDVITYSQSGDGTFFVRREEFASVACDCTLKTASGSPETSGKRPTIWAGDEYAQGHFVDKPYGVSNNNSQSVLCSTCCRDHHDGGSHGDDHADTAVNQFNPFRSTGDYFTSGSFDGDHKHYNRDNRGNLVLADSNNDDYVEACRLVRVNGFFEVVQDFRQEDHYTFPEDWLDDSGEITTYSNYVTSAANAYENASYPNYEVAPPCIGGPSPCVAEPTYGAVYNATDPPVLADGEFPVWTQLPLDGAATQQLRSRGIYIDYLSSDLRSVVDCLRLGGNASSCQTGEVILDLNTSTNILEIVPFFDVQLTHLNRWNETPTNTPVDTTNEGLEDDNAHSRGVASEDNTGASTVEAKGHKGNLGFTDTLAIDENFTGELSIATINVQSLEDDGSGGGGTDPPPSGDPIVAGLVTETVNGIKATDIEVTGTNGALCDRTPDGYECGVPAGASNPRLYISGYGGNGKDRWVCMTDSQLVLNNEVVNGINAQATFELHNTEAPHPTGTTFHINVQDSACVAAEV